MLQGELSLFAKKYNKLYVCCMGRMVVLRRSIGKNHEWFRKKAYLVLPKRLLTSWKKLACFLEKGSLLFVRAFGRC